MDQLRVTDYYAQAKASRFSPELAARLLRSSRSGEWVGRRERSPGAALADDSQRSCKKLRRSPSQPQEKMLELKPHLQILQEPTLEPTLPLTPVPYVSDLQDLPKSLVHKGLDPEEDLKRAGHWISKEDRNNLEAREIKPEIKEEQTAYEGHLLPAVPVFELLDRENCLKRVREIEARVQKLKAMEEEQKQKPIEEKQKLKAMEELWEQKARVEACLPPQPVFQLLDHKGRLQRIQQIETHVAKLKAIKEENWISKEEEEEWKAKEKRCIKEEELGQEGTVERWLPPRPVFELLDRQGCRKRLLQIEAHVAKLKAVEEKKQRAREEKEWKTKEKEPKRLGSQVKEKSPSPEDAPVCHRVHTLAQTVTLGMPLPHKYTMLAEMFCSMDTIVTSLFNQCETVTFAKVKQGVQNTTHKPFEESNVGQIKTVYPSAYHFSLESSIPVSKDSVKKLDGQLTIQPLAGDECNDQRQFCALCLMERRHIFEGNLVDIVKQHHTVFLESLDPPVIIRGQITRWHPRFDVESVPEIPAAELPQPPQVNRLSTALEVLKKAHKVLTPKLEKAFTNLTWSSPNMRPVEKRGPAGDPVSEGPLVSISEALKGIPKIFQDRIQASESQKRQALLIRNLQQEERLAMMSRLPDVARLLRNVFVFEKKPVLTMEVACNRAITSYHSSMTLREMEIHLLLLSELVPNWLSIYPVQAEIYLKLDNKVELSLVLDALGKKVKEEDR
ncbi:DNA replication factor Cdt1-like isoform X2 [Pleurodeles waltl]|uniref:DNA replication factor Cdt1-like isoform X2 n=1 Tax=Pleurodeles waltl TaxID=8319 RepID=UPI0037095A15